MKRIILFPLLILLLVFCTKEHISLPTQKINFGDREILIGNKDHYRQTKECKIESYSLTKDSIGSSGKLTKTEILKTKDGKIIEKNSFDSSARFEYKHVYTYSPLNSITIINYGRDGTILENVIEKRDNWGNILEKLIFFTDSTVSDNWFYSYNLSEKKVEFQNTYNLKHAMMLTYSVHYLDENYNVTETHFKSENNRIISRWKFQYNSQSQLICKEEFNHQDRQALIMRFIYDEKQRISEITKTEFPFGDTQDSLIKKFYYTYADY